MTICGVICELNPFHKGHEYLFNEARKITGADIIIAIMSGDFVQRGIPAVCDKYSRTQMALKGGADVVIELPTIYSTASADYFAFGAVSALDNLRCVDFLCFGSESGDLYSLKKYVKNNFLNDNSPHILNQGIRKPGYNSLVSDYLKEGDSYAKAMSRINGEDLGSNDMLGVAYIKSLKILNSDIEPVVIKRSGSNYLDVSEDSNSATAIRRKIVEGKEYSANIPEYVREILEEAEFDRFPINIDDFSIQLFTRINTIIHKEERGEDSLTAYMDVSNNIAGRIRNNINDYISYDDFISCIHSKEYTKSRVMRALLHILLDIRKSDYSEDLLDCFTPFVRILGFNSKGRNALSIIKENSIVPVIAKAKDAEKILDEDALKVFNMDVYAANIYEQACTFKFKNSPIHDLRKEIIIVQ